MRWKMKIPGKILYIEQIIWGVLKQGQVETVTNDLFFEVKTQIYKIYTSAECTIVQLLSLRDKKKLISKIFPQITIYDTPK